MRRIATPKRRPVAARTASAAAPGEVLLRRADVGALDLERDPGVGAGDLEGVMQGHPAEQRLDAVVAGGLAGQDPEEEVDLGGAVEGERARSCPAPRRALAANAASSTADQAPIRVIGMKVVTWYMQSIGEPGSSGIWIERGEGRLDGELEDAEVPGRLRQRRSRSSGRPAGSAPR